MMTMMNHEDSRACEGNHPCRILAFGCGEAGAAPQRVVMITIIIMIVAGDAGDASDDWHHRCWTCRGCVLIVAARDAE